MNNKNIIAIPSWVVPILTRNNLRLADVFSYDKLSKVLSIEDLSSLVSLNTLLSSHPNPDNVFKNINVNDIGYIWEQSSVNKPKANYEITKVIYPLVNSNSITSEVIPRLNSSSDVSHFSNNKSAKKTLYTVVDAERDSIVIVLYSGFFESLNDSKFQYGIYKRLLELFYVYFGSTKSFQTSLFCGYVRLLNKLSFA